jgi:predicted nicotinamide N-methyase
MPTPSPADLRAFVRRHTRLAPVPGIAGIRLHLADDVTVVWRRAGDELGQVDPPLPFWAFAWAGGLGVARHLEEHPHEVAGRHVLDLASGSGLCAFAALRAGAASVHAVDIDPLAAAAVAVNARANHVRVGFSRRDLLDGDPPGCDVILAGDICYEAAMSERMLAWLHRAANGGARVLIGDPGRKYLPPGLERVASYRVQTSRELESTDARESTVYTIPTAVIEQERT